MDWEHIIPSIDRVLLVSWLLKDFGWMSTNIYLGWPFGITAIVYHTLALIFDPRRAFRFYNTSFLLWVIGNFIWLTLEYCNEPLSSDIHWGPHIPVAPMSEDTTFVLSLIKLLLFISSLLIQCVMYIGIYYKKVEMPRNFDEDIVNVNQLARLLGRRDVSNTGSMTSRLKINDAGHYSHFHHLTVTNALYINEEQAALPISTAFVEYTYIIFWIMKDLFWSISTGDLAINSLDFTVGCEIIALVFGATAFCVYCISAYIYRRHLLSFLDSVTTLLWIAANYVWMSGEFFLRYQNMKFDDFDQGDDGTTRLVSTILFISGILIQIGIIVYLSINKFCKRKHRVKFVPSMESISFNVKKKKSKTSFSKILYTSTTPQNHSSSDNMSYNNLPVPTSSSSSVNGDKARAKLGSIDIDYNYNDNNDILLMTDGNNNNSNNNTNNNKNSNNNIGLHHRSVFGISGGGHSGNNNHPHTREDWEEEDVEDEVMVVF